MTDQEPFAPNTGEADRERSQKRPRIAITLGDTNGVGPEVVLKCLADSRLMKFLEPVVVGSAHAFKVHANKLGYRDLRFHVVQDLPPQLSEGEITVLDVARGEKPEVHFGKITEDAGPAQGPRHQRTTAGSISATTTRASSRSASSAVRSV
jgi:4-hydroxythreonine-4-phosphate dehydrogenase